MSWTVVSGEVGRGCCGEDASLSCDEEEVLSCDGEGVLPWEVESEWSCTEQAREVWDEGVDVVCAGE